MIKAIVIYRMIQIEPIDKKGNSSHRHPPGNKKPERTGDSGPTRHEVLIGMIRLIVYFFINLSS